MIISVFIVDSWTASDSIPDFVIVVVVVVVVLDGDDEVLNPKIVGLGLGVVVEAKVNRLGRKTPAKPVEIVRPVVNCELSGNVIVVVVCAGGAVVVGAKLNKFGRNIPENPVDIVLPVVMSVARLPSAFVVFVVVVVEVVEVKVVVVVDVLVVVDSRLIPKFSSKSVSDTMTISVVVPELSEENPNSSSSITESF